MGEEDIRNERKAKGIGTGRGTVTENIRRQNRARHRRTSRQIYEQKDIGRRTLG